LFVGVALELGEASLALAALGGVGHCPRYAVGEGEGETQVPKH